MIILNFTEFNKKVALDGDVVKNVAKSLYLGDVLSSERGVQEIISAIVRCEWKKFKDIANALCKRVLSLKLRGSMYKSYVRNALFHGAECWGLKKDGERKLQTTEMRILHIIYGETLRDCMSNETTCEMIGVEKIEEIFEVQRLQ